MPAPVATAGRGTSTDTDTARQSICLPECPTRCGVSNRNVCDRSEGACRSNGISLGSKAMPPSTIAPIAKDPAANAPFAIVARTAR